MNDTQYNMPVVHTAHPTTPPPMTEAQASAHLREKHLQMIKDAQQAGREIPAQPVYASVVGEDLARTAVEASQRTMRLAARRMFTVPALPWVKDNK